MRSSGLRYHFLHMSNIQNRRSLRPLLAAAFFTISCQLAPCQCSIGLVTALPDVVTPTAQMPAFEVATIKPPDPNGFAPPLRFYIQQAFGISPNIAGRVIGPDWINSAKFVIRGKPSESIATAMQNMPIAERMKENDLMMQSLLADRFQMKAHFETREMPVYELVVSKSGSKLQEDSDPTKRRASMSMSMVRATAVPVTALLGVLECAPDVGGREVVDKTGLTGDYDINLQWTPLQANAAAGGESTAASSPDPGGTSVFTAVEEQLGLKLVPAKAQAKVLVIDHIEQPTPN